MQICLSRHFVARQRLEIGPSLLCDSQFDVEPLLVVRDMWLEVLVLVFRNNYCKLIMSKADCRTLMSCGHSMCLHATIISFYHHVDSTCRYGLPIKELYRYRRFSWCYKNLNHIFVAHSRAERVGEKYEFYEGHVNEGKDDLVLLRSTHFRRDCEDKQMPQYGCKK